MRVNTGEALKFGATLLPLAGAIKINIEAAQGQSGTWALVGVGFVVFGAVCIENATHLWRRRQFAGVLLWGGIGLVFLALNISNALGNAAAHSDHSRDENRSKMAAATRNSEQRTQWSQRRSELAKFVGGKTPGGIEVSAEATPGSIDAKARELKAREAKIWSASFSCDPSWITKAETKTFCAEIAALEAKKDAAGKRDELDAQLATLATKAETAGEGPSSADSQAARIKDSLSALGYQANEEAIILMRDWAKAVGVELLAGFGRVGILLLLSFITPPAMAAPAKKPAVSSQPAAAATAPETEEPAPDAYQDFILGMIEPCQGEHIPAGALYRAWQTYCESHGLNAGAHQGFGRVMKKRLQHDKNHGRPRYCNVRLRSTHAPLRLAVVNAQWPSSPRETSPGGGRAQGRKLKGQS